MRMMCTMKSNVHPNTCINSVDDEVAMIQHLLDTDLIYDHPEFCLLYTSDAADE